jgi:hypothetical protein
MPCVLLPSQVRPHLMDLAWQGLERSEEFSLEEYR